MQVPSEYQQARLSRDPRFDGQFFVAVKTTGIFCRPICPANLPKEQNIEYYPAAQLAMQAGYRPCLRCRPDSAPGSFAWKGVDTTLERGLRLLSEYPQLSVEQIATKLGISARYFRALMQKKLGIGPKHYRLYEQVLFAKQLLHQTQLSVEHVAQASGFGSARRLQHNLKSTTGLTPKQIRQRQLAASQHIQLTLSFRPPYNWPQVRDFLARRAVTPIEKVTDTSYARSFELGDCQGEFEACYDQQAKAFQVSLHLSDVTALKAVVANIRRILDLDADTRLINHQLAQTGLEPQALLPGLRLPGVWDPFEAGCRAVLGQQVSVTAAIRLVSLLVENCGDSQQPVRYFPSPQQVAQSDLLFLKMPDSRRQSLRRLAQFFVDYGSDHPPQQWLDIKGIGPWTVAYAQLRGLSQPDIWLGTDLVIKKQLAKYDLQADHARPWRSYLTFQLWSMA